MPQLSQRERDVIDRIVRGDGKQPIQAWKMLNKGRLAKLTKLGKRMSKMTPGLSRQAVCNYVRGTTHREFAKETRGRQSILTKADIGKLIVSGAA